MNNIQVFIHIFKKTLKTF